MIAVERMTRRDWVWPGLFLALGVIGAVIAARFFFQAFPEASIDLRLARPEIARLSESFLRGRGFDPSRYRHVTVFDFDDQAKTYLERELGAAEANRVMASRTSVWRWRTRWIQPPMKEEFSVWLNTRGELVGFDHQVEEKREGARLSKDEAQRIAEVFLRAERRIDLSRFTLVTDDLKERPSRLDYTFTWEERDVRFRDARPRMSVTVLGDQVGTFREFLKIPEQWVRDYERLRSRNGVYQTIATVLYAALFLASIVVMIRSARRVSWKALLGICGVAGVLFMANFLNEFGLQTRFIPTNVTWEMWTTLYLIGAVLIGVMVTLYVLVPLAAGEPLYRDIAPGRVSLAHLFTFPGLRSKEFFTSTLIGYGMAGMHIGLVVLFYVLAHRFGAWAPLEVPYSNSISTALPWLSPLATSVFAASSEEFAFRLFAIPLLLRWTRNKWIAVIVPAFVWGFLHSAYPQQPAWIRGVEVGLIGVVAGWVFLRFGILATLVWHYTVDAVLIGMFLFRSENILYKVSGALVGDAVLLPLVIGGAFYIQSRGFLRDPHILNGAPELEEEAEIPAAAPIQAPPPSSIAPAAARSFAFASKSALLKLGLASAIAVIALVAIDVPRPGEHVTVKVSLAQAEAIAVAHLRVLEVPVESFRRVTWLEDGITGDEAEYLIEHGGVTRAAAIYRDRVPAVFWRTRLFQPPKKEEYAVWVTPAGEVARLAHTLDEKAPGAKLEKPEALARAQAFLQQNAERARVRLSEFRLVEHDLERRDARNDHKLVWEGFGKLLAEATHRIEVAVKGDEVAGPRHWIKVPEDWQRAHTRPTLFTVLPVILIVAVALTGLALFARALRRVPVRWRSHVWLGIGAAVFQMLILLNTMPSLQQTMETSVPWETSMLLIGLGGAVAALFAGATLTFLSVAAQTLLADRFGPLTLWPSTPAERGRAVLQGLVAGLLAALVLAGLASGIDWFRSSLPSAVSGVKSGVPSVEASFVPSLGIVLAVLIAALWSTLLFGGALGVLLRLFKSRAALAAALFAGTLLLASSALDPMHFVKNWAGVLATAVAMAAIVASLRGNIAGYFFMFLISGAVSRIAPLMKHPGLSTAGTIAAIVVVALLAVVAGWAWSQTRRRESELATVAAATTGG